MHRKAIGVEIAINAFRVRVCQLCYVYRRLLRLKIVMLTLMRKMPR